MNITVVGTGYVGLVTGTCLAETGNHVCCVDIDEHKIEKLHSGLLPIYEPGLDTLFERNLKEGRLSFTTCLQKGVEHAEIIILALPTPPGEDGSADLKYVLEVAHQLGELLTSYKIIIDKSTVPVGTAKKIRAAIQKNYDGDFDIVSNPEFLREGMAVGDFMKPNRIVIGTGSEKARTILAELYAPYVRQGNPVIFMDERSAELTKYAANAFLALKISFMNEVAQLCERLEADVEMIRMGIGSDERIGKRFLFPGIGYGGSCFPKDVKALLFTAKEAGYEFKILEAVTKVNEMQKIHLVNKIRRYYSGDLSGKHFVLWGLSFKPNTDDIREAPALEIIRELLGLGASVAAFDPVAMHNAKALLGEKITCAETQYEALHGADALIVATEWNEFRTPDFDKMLTLLKDPVVFDGRNVYEMEQMQKRGFHYESVGRSLVNQLANLVQ